MLTVWFRFIWRLFVEGRKLPVPSFSCRRARSFALPSPSRLVGVSPVLHDGAASLLNHCGGSGIVSRRDRKRFVSMFLLFFIFWCSRARRRRCGLYL